MKSFNELSKVELRKQLEKPSNLVKPFKIKSLVNLKQYNAHFSEIDNNKYVFTVIDTITTREVYRQTTKRTTDIENIKQRAKSYINSYYGLGQVAFTF